MLCQHKALPEVVVLFLDSSSSSAFYPFDPLVCFAVSGCLFCSAARRKQKELGKINGEHWNEENSFYISYKTAYFLNKSKKSVSHQLLWPRATEILQPIVLPGDHNGVTERVRTSSGLSEEENTTAIEHPKVKQ